MSKKLLKSGVIVSFMTFLSRILGLIRDVVVANMLGAGAAADVFLVANKIPNFLRRLFAEGAFAQAFIPVLSEVKGEGDEAHLRLFIAKVSGTLGVIVTIVTILGVLGSPVVAAIFGAGWFVDYINDGPHGDKFEPFALMLKITFPYLFFVSLTGLSGAILNTLNKFAVAAFTPVLLNVAIISCALYLSPYFDNPEFALAWGVFIGGLMQLMFQIPFLYRAGVLVKPQWAWSDPKVRKVRMLMIPALFGVSVSQINLLIDTMIATTLMTGSVSWLYYSDRLLEFPLGLFGIAIATVILPTLSKQYVSKDRQSFSNSMEWGIKVVCLLGAPAAAGLFVLAEPMLLTIFYGGAFTSEDATMASYSLMAYSTGLLSFMLVKVLAPGFYSRQDLKTPVRFGIYCMVANIFFNIALAIPYGYVGLAIATAMSATMNATLLYVQLHRLGVFQITANTLVFLLKVLIGCVVMVLVIKHFNSDIAVWRSMDTLSKALELAKLILSGFFSFVVTLLLVGVRVSSFVGTHKVR
ncbi:murein biosynthesis integral membrane protein MurJ [Aliiglaciecola sp. 3_MG-2023]|uniref:murein biosynthesis integral membrane protein MurJ n=1 Tax=Aliiglaciecola sp. 3_MG-2023 TaxID=3062644 RepID=UPI0026E4286F|nr:murein biosynthesis integral membrane protein MurJ [Aliiglaciecola sp. 3_MG-2023]MDO6694035.1 murein biosynthesis integral membrane protein MurJ [Aliiglaciecola sp. 3_MG-2023]